ILKHAGHGEQGVETTRCTFLSRSDRLHGAEALQKAFTTENTERIEKKKSSAAMFFSVFSAFQRGLALDSLPSALDSSVRFLVLPPAERAADRGTHLLDAPQTILHAAARLFHVAIDRFVRRRRAIFHRRAPPDRFLGRLLRFAAPFTDAPPQILPPVAQGVL